MSFEGWIFFGVTYGREAKDVEEKVKLLRLSEDATRTLAKVFGSEVSSFLDRENQLYVENPVYNCDPETEVFKVEDYSLPADFTEAIDRWQSLDSLEPEEMVPDQVKVIMGVEQTESGIITAFKKLNRSRILDREATWFLWNNNTFDTVDGPGFVLPEGLAAVHTQGDLFFDKERTVNAFLDLTAYFREATREEVEQLIGSGPLEWRGNKPIQNVVSKRCKRLMYMFISRGGFSDPNISTAGIRDVAAEIGLTVDLDTENGQEIIVLPDTSKDITHVFEILTHHYSPGIWDGLWRRYNSAQIVPGQQPPS